MAWSSSGFTRVGAASRSASTPPSGALDGSNASSTKRSYIPFPTIMCCHSGTGRCSETTTDTSPRTSASHAPNSSAFDTVADSEIKPDLRREVDDHLLPDRAAEPVGEVVDLVHDDVPEPHEGGRGRIHHVAEHLGGHDDDRRLAVDRGVTGEQADVAGAVATHEVGVLLVGEGLDRRGVERLSPGRHREVDGELAHHRLAGAGRGGDEDAVARLQRLARLELERVQREAQRRRERRELTLPSSRHGAHAMSRRRAPRGPPRGRAAAARTAPRPPG